MWSICIYKRHLPLQSNILNTLLSLNTFTDKNINIYPRIDSSVTFKDITTWSACNALTMRPLQKLLCTILPVSLKQRFFTTSWKALASSWKAGLFHGPMRMWGKRYYHVSIIDAKYSWCVKTVSSGALIRWIEWDTIYTHLMAMCLFICIYSPWLRFVCIRMLFTYYVICSLMLYFECN